MSEGEPTGSSRTPSSDEAQDPAATEVRGSIWADPDELDPDWRPPSRLSLVPRWVKVLTPVVALALVVAVVWSLGGFKGDRSLVNRVPFGTTIKVGGIEITPRFAEWKWSTTDEQWQASVAASCRLPDVDVVQMRGFELSRAVWAGRVNYRETSTDTVSTFGGSRTLSGIDMASLTPGAPAVPCSFSFQFDRQLSGKTPPENVVNFLVLDVVHVKEDRSQEGGAGWKIGSGPSTIMQVPAVVRQLPRDS